jgi:N-acetylmuramoyl-L-alanine amidase
MRFVTVTIGVLLMLSSLCVIAPAQARETGADYKTGVVVIDPGHGGKDQGAAGPGQTLEKDVVLQIARRLQRLVNSAPGMQAVLTRNGDEFRDLYERITIARRHKADLFISIHANAVTHPESSGAAVFVLSTRGASSAAAHWLANDENAAGSIGRNSPDIKDEALRAVVFDIYHDAVLVKSMALAERVLAQLRQVGDIHTGTVERAGFAVLKAPDTPSILVETGFISNPQEAARLRSGPYQQRLAEAIMRGIRAYVRQREPQYLTVLAEPAVKLTSRSQSAAAPASQSISRSSPKSKLEGVSPGARHSRVATRVHVIKPGETLTGIAQRYRVHLSDLRSVNGLGHDQSRIPAGTSLTIPVGSDS